MLLAICSSKARQDNEQTLKTGQNKCVLRKHSMSSKVWILADLCVMQLANWFAETCQEHEGTHNTGQKQCLLAKHNTWLKVWTPACHIAVVQIFFG